MSLKKVEPVLYSTLLPSPCHNGFPDVQPFPLDKIWECVQWIDQRIARGHRVLVHCAEGNSRSVSVVIAYLLYKGNGLDQAKKNDSLGQAFLYPVGKGN